MRLLALLVLCVMVAMHHGVPVLGHEGHAAASQVATGGHGQHGVPDQPDDPGAAAGACLAVLVVVGLAVALGARRPGLPRGTASRLRVPISWAAVSPPAHGPPRPIRPCVLQR